MSSPMNALSAVAAAPRTQAAAPESAPVDAGGDGGFAAALESAREPVKAPASGNANGAAKSGTKGTPKPACGANARTEPARDPNADPGAVDEAASNESEAGVAAPDLPPWLAGWPVAPAPVLANPTQTPALDAALGGPGSPAVPTSALQAKGGAANPSDAARDDRADTAVASIHAAAAALALAASDTEAALDSTSSLQARASDATLPAAPARSADAAAAPALPAWQAGSVAPASTAASAPAHAGASAATPFEARLAAALDSAAFAPALATQVSWLASEGVQHARLSLNPLEMGPLAVKIVLDGTQARIDFTADVAGTRAAIEASLPALAAALHDNGLTLAGGGVFDGQARQQAQGGAGGRSPPGGRAGGAPVVGDDAGTLPTARVARGLVDYFA